MRKAYLYSLEGVLASMLVVFYLSTIITAPVAEDWTRTSLSKRSGDLVAALTATGWMDTAVKQDSPAIIDGLLAAMDTQMAYSMHIRGLPQRQMSMLIAMTGDDIMRTGTAPNTSALGPGLPASTSGYRHGRIEGVHFAVADTAENGRTKFTTVRFDFTDDGEWDDAAGAMDEGPYSFGDLVRWCPNGSCTAQRFRVGYINDSLTLYNVTSYTRLRRTASFEANGFNIHVATTASELFAPINVSGSDFQKQGAFWTTDIPFNGVTLDINLSAASGNTSVYVNESAVFEGPYEEGEQFQAFGGFYTIDSIDPENGTFYATPANTVTADILFLDGVSPSYVDVRNRSIAAFLLEGNTLFERIDMEGMTADRFASSFQRRLGFRWVELSLVRQGSPTNVFARTGGTSTAAGFISSYFYATDLYVPRSLFADVNSYAVANITIRGRKYRVNASKEGTVEIGGSLTDAPTYTRDATFEAEGNLFTVESTYPLNLSLGRPYRFRNRLNATMTGGQPVLEVRDWRWNVSEAADVSRNISTSTQAGGGERYAGVPETDCQDGTLYRNATFTLEGSTYKVVLTNFGDSPCNPAFEYVTFDFNGNETFNDDDNATGEQFSKEGVHQARQTVVIDGKQYQLFIGPEGRWLYLQRVPPPSVPTMLWQEEAYRGNGEVFYMGGRSFGDDGRGLLKAGIARAAVGSYRFTAPKLMGSPSVGIRIPDALDGAVYSPYTVNSVWWFQ